MSNAFHRRQAKNLIVRNAHVVDPFHKIDEVLELYVKNGKLQKWGKKLDAPADADVFDAKGLYLFPGFIDLQVHFRDPGFENKETIEGGVLAAISGGFSACVTMPNTKPTCDNAQVVKYQIDRGALSDFNIFPAGALTQGINGQKISEISEMKNAGAVAVTDGLQWLQDSGVARRAYEYATTYDMVVMSQAEDARLSAAGVMNESVVSTRLGLRGRPGAAEDIATARDLELARLTGCKLHLMNVSTKRAVEYIREAKQEGIRVTAQVTPHHLMLTENDFITYDTNFKISPPLRSSDDQRALLEGLKDGTIDAIGSDHSPHAAEDKDMDVEVAPDGVVGSESYFGAIMTVLYHGQKIALSEIVRKMSLLPSEIINKSKLGKLSEGDLANFVLADLNHEWIFEPKHIRSKSKNSCFFGRKFKGRILHNFVNGYHYDLLRT